jgi:hypothetical protein
MMKKRTGMGMGIGNQGRIKIAKTKLLALGNKGPKHEAEKGRQKTKPHNWRCPFSTTRPRPIRQANPAAKPAKEAYDVHVAMRLSMHPSCVDARAWLAWIA